MPQPGSVQRLQLCVGQLQRRTRRPHEFVRIGDDGPVTAWVHHDEPMIDASGINIEPLIDEMTGCLNRHHPLNRREDPDPAAVGGSLRREGEGSVARAEYSGPEAPEPESDHEVFPRSDQVARVVNEKFHIIHDPHHPRASRWHKGLFLECQRLANVHEGLVPECQRQRPQRKAPRQALNDSAHAVAAAAALRLPPLPAVARPIKTNKWSWRK